MSYTTIKIDGKDIGIRFGYPCVRWFTEAGIEDKDFFDTGSNLTDIGVAKLLQFAYKNQCVVKEEKQVLGYEDFYNWVENNIGVTGEMSTELTEIIQVFNDSLPVKKLNGVEEKKSQTKKKIKPASTT